MWPKHQAKLFSFLLPKQSEIVTTHTFKKIVCIIIIIIIVFILSFYFVLHFILFCVFFGEFFVVVVFYSI